MSNPERPPRARPDDAEAYPYVLTNQIGKGSFATVYRGYHVKNRRAVAVKAVKTDILKAKLLDNLESEIAILKSLNHRHITSLIDIVKAENHVYIIMDYCSGGDLSQYIKARGKVESLQYVPEPGAAPIYFPHPKTGGLDERVVKSLLLQLADALKFLRRRDLMHRDLKPQNLLLQPAAPDDIALGHLLGAPILKVADFGFARILPTASLAETLCGSPLYMAPEILSYEKYDARADLWSVGAVLYEMSVGRPPFRANNHIELLNKIKRANSRVPFPDEDRDPIKAAEATPIPTDIKQLIRMLLRRNPVERADYDEFFKSKALQGLSSPFFTHARGMEALTSSSNPFAPKNPKPTVPPITILESSHVPKKPPAPSNPPADPNMLAVQDMPIGPDGQPYDPRLYTVQDTFHIRRKKHRDKDKDRGRGGQNGNAKSNGGSPISGTDRTDTQGDSGSRKTSGTSSPLLYSVDVEGVLKQDYVLVEDTRAVEFNRVADEIEAAARKKPSLSRKTADNLLGYPPRSQTPRTTVPPSFRSDGPGTDNRANGPAAIDGATNQKAYPPPPDPPPLPPFATAYRSGDTPSKKDYTFPPAPQIANNGTAFATPLLIKPPASALARALNIASKKLFGSPTNFADQASSGSPGSITRRESDHYSSNPNSPRFVVSQLPDSDSTSGKTGGARPGSPAQDDLLLQLEALAHKAHVLAEWADKKFDKVEASPSKPLSDPAQFVKRKGEAPHRAESRRKREIEIETHAVQCVSLYFTVMAFSQKAIDLIRAYYRTDENSGPSPGIDNALAWARDAFSRSMEKVNTLKAWLPEGYSPKNMWIDRVIYDHALELLRHAASLELRAENFRQCEEEYQRALWMLHAIQDDVLQFDNPYADQDRETISNFVSTTKTRLRKLQQRLAEMEVAQASS